MTQIISFKKAYYRVVSAAEKMQTAWKASGTHFKYILLGKERMRSTWIKVFKKLKEWPMKIRERC